MISMGRMIARTAVVTVLCLSCGQAPEDDHPASGQGVERSSSALSSCAWGGAAWRQPGFINLDRMVDVVSPNGGSVDQYIATGAPQFTFTFSQPTVTNAWGGGDYTWVRDFTGDGREDIASASGGNIYMKIASGSGFASSTWTVPNQWGTSGYTFAGNFTGDNKADIATAFGGTINLFSSTGSGFQLITSSVTNAWGGSNYTWAGDFTGDGIADIASPSGGNVYMKIGSASGHFSSAVWTVTNVWGGSNYTWAADFDGNGMKDFASASGGNVYVKLSTGSGFVSTVWTVANQWGDSTISSSNGIADLNGDGREDLVSLASYNSNLVYVKLANGWGFDSATWQVDQAAPWGDATWIGDFTGDGKQDIATFFTSTCQGKLYESTGSGFVTHYF